MTLLHKLHSPEYRLGVVDTVVSPLNGIPKKLFGEISIPTNSGSFVDIANSIPSSVNVIVSQATCYRISPIVQLPLPGF
jgi:hypothetical protein